MQWFLEDLVWGWQEITILDLYTYTQQKATKKKNENPSETKYTPVLQ